VNTIRILRLFSCLVLMGASLPAWAVDVVPLAGFRFGGDLRDTNDSAASRSFTIDSTASYGGVIDLPLPAEYGAEAIELYFSRQQATLHDGRLLGPALADLRVDVLHLGLADTIPTNDPRLSWLLIGSAGATRFETGAGSDTRPSIGLGGAVRWMANAHVGLRGDLRALVSFTGGGDTALACNGGCRVFYAGTAVVQGEASVGIVLRF
jgi:hypothetical protein